MPRIDPRLAVIMAVAVILSTLVVITIFRPIQPDVITPLRNRYPEVFVKESAQKGIETTFSFAALSGRDMEDLELRFSILYQEQPKYDEGKWEPVEETSIEEIASHLPIITTLEAKVAALGGDYETLHEELDVNGTRYDAILYDFSRFLGIFNDDEELSRWISMFAILKRGSEVRFFQGRTGFFLSQEEVVKYLMISHNDEKTEYLGSQIIEAPYGILRYSDVGKDDKFSIIFEVLSATDQLPEILLGAKDRMILQVIKGYADGDLELLLANGVPLG